MSAAASVREDAGEPRYRRDHIADGDFGVVKPISPFATLTRRTPRSAAPLTRSGTAAHARRSDPAAVRKDGAAEILLAAARPFDDGFAPLRPLWLCEAKHRARSMLRLLSALRQSDFADHPLRRQHERQLALHIAETFAALETARIRDPMPCAGPLRDLVRGLVALFGPVVGDVLIATEVAPVSLPAFRRRALVLLTSELVLNTLIHAFHGRTGGCISVTLRYQGPCHAQLTVADDGVGLHSRIAEPRVGVAGALADLLEAEIRYVRTECWTTAAELSFPLR